MCESDQGSDDPAFVSRSTNLDLTLTWGIREMDGPPTDHQEVLKKNYTAHLQLASPREGIPTSISSPNLVQSTLPTDSGEDGPPSPQFTKFKRASSVPRPTERPPTSAVHVDLKGAKLERFRQWLYCLIIGAESHMSWMP